MANASSNEFDLTPTDVGKKIREFAWGDISSDIEDMITAECVMVHVQLSCLGMSDSEIDEISATRHRRLYHSCRLIVLWRVSAELLQDFSSELSDASLHRERKAKQLEDLINNRPECFIEDWSNKKHRGSWVFGDEVGSGTSPRNWKYGE